MWRGGVGVTVHELLAEVRTVLELLRLFFFHGSEISDADGGCGRKETRAER